MDYALPRNSYSGLYRFLCAACLRAHGDRRPGIATSSSSLKNRDRSQTRLSSTSSNNQQASPLKGYYKLLLDQPLQKTKSATQLVPTVPPLDKPPKSDREERIAKARVIFGSRLAGPAERRDEIGLRSTNFAGVLVPPRPLEPDNCCMSGCVNCVWDRYRDEMEEWAAKSSEARRRLLLKRAGSRGTIMSSATAQEAAADMARSIDDDGGGSEKSWDMSLLDTGQVDLYSGIPVGIREFMRTEKLLKERHAREVVDRK